MAMIDRNFTFATNGTVSAADLHNLIDSATIYQDLITGQLPITSVGTNYELLIADATNPNAAPNAVTVYDLFEDALTAGTYTNANISAALTYGTATGTRLVSANATITTGTITTGVIPSLTSSTATFGTTTSTAATITSGTITNLASTTGTIVTLNSTTGTIGTLNSTTGTIGNLSTTLAGDFTISSGTGTLGTSGVTLGTYGGATSIPVLAIDAKGRVTTASTSAITSGLTGFRNRIINGDMRIDQRNAGASVSVTNGTVTYIADRWNVYEDTSGSISSQRSTTAPDGYSNSLLVSVVGSGSATAAQTCRVQQRIEGFNFSDLAFGTSSAQSVSVSFWVRSSLTGTYSVSIRNATIARSYVATYAISSANTWERKTVTITGDTSGTWVTDNGVGAFLDFDLGSGSNSNTTAGAWVASDKNNTSSQANWIGTGSSTFYITGVQLEQGSSATDFERRPIGTELALCQRYYLKKAALTINGLALAGNASVTNVQQDFPDTFPTMRSSPVASVSAASDFTIYVAAVTRTATNLQATNTSPASCWWIAQNNNISQTFAVTLYASNANAFLQYNSEL
jgi:hypothetical protein